MRRRVQQDEPPHWHGIIGYMAVIALRIAHAQRHRSISELELPQIRVVRTEQTIEQRDTRLNATFAIHPHPAAVKLRFDLLNCDQRRPATPLGELSDHDL